VLHLDPLLLGFLYKLTNPQSSPVAITAELLDLSTILTCVPSVQGGKTP
jgi:hypothetical protein